MREHLDELGWAIVRSNLRDELLDELISHAFVADAAGTRCLLDLAPVARAARLLRDELCRMRVLEDDAVAIQAIAFDKTPGANWKVTWHQDVMFPFAKTVSAPGFDLPCVKHGVDYARPPRKVLENLLAVRLHLDDCDGRNGPLRVISGSQKDGVLRSTELTERVAQGVPQTCLARRGEVLLMRPLTLHASSPALSPRHRRVLHLVYHSGEPTSEIWHRSI